MNKLQLTKQKTKLGGGGARTGGGGQGGGAKEHCQSKVQETL